MTADFLRYFYSSSFNDKIVLKNFYKTYSVIEIKQLICRKMAFLRTVKEKNIVISGESNFYFIINFLACIFCNKEIYLLNEPKKLDEFGIKYFYLSGENTESDVCLFPDIDFEKIFVNFITSGSSGKEKFVKKSLQNLVNEAKDIIGTFGFDKNYEFISTTDLVHLFGMSFHFMTAFLNGNVINTDVVNYPEDIKLKNLILVTTPSFLEKLQKYEEVPSRKPSYIISAGAKLENPVFEYAQKISKNVIEIYGSTESGVIAYRTSFETNELNIFENVKIKSYGENGSDITTDYSIERTNRIEDLIEVLPSQKIILKGRLDRVLKIQEKRISAVAVEEKIQNSYLVEHAYCLKMFDKLVCMAVLTQDGISFVKTNGMVELIKKLKSYLNGSFQILPQRWKFVDEIPKKKNGKIDVKKITDIFNLNLSYPLILQKKVLAEKANIKLCFYKNCNFFKGHFDNFQLTPGVVQLFYASYFIKDVFDINCDEGQIRKIKFNNIILPDTILNLELVKGEKNVTYKYYDEEKTYSSGIFPLENLLKDI